MKCSDTHFVVYFNKTGLDARTDPFYNNRSYSIKFSNSSSPSCRVNFGDLSTVGKDLDVSVPHNRAYPSIYVGTMYADDLCGIEVTSDNDYIYYNATVTVTYGENPNSFIRREEYDNYVVTCLRNRTVEHKLHQYNVQTRLTGSDKQGN